jgi:DnaA-homolog protein
MQQIPLPMGPQAEPSLANFVEGDNAAAVAHLATLVDNGSARPDAGALLPPVYLWGASGSGKTHLLQGVLRQAAVAGHAAASFDATSALPWELPVACRMLTIDDCERLDASRQQAAFALFVEAAGAGIRIVAAGRLPPVDLSLRDDLRTRLGWGPVFALRPLSEAHTRAALQREAERRGIGLPDEVLRYLLTHCPRDLRSLMTLLDQLDQFSLARGRRVTLPLLRELLAGDRVGNVGSVVSVAGGGELTPAAANSGAAAPSQTLHPA